MPDHLLLEQLLRRPSTVSAVSIGVRGLLAAAFLVVTVSGCVLNHPSDPVNPASVAWYSQNRHLVDALMADAANATQPPARATLADMRGYCAKLGTDGSTAQKRSLIPSSTLDNTWQSGLRYLVRAADECKRGLDATPPKAGNDVSHWAGVLRPLRNNALEDLAFGTALLRTVIGAFGGPMTRLPPGIAPATTVASAATVTSATPNK